MDQFSRRHDAAANIAYLDGSVGAFKTPIGGSNLLQEPNVRIANHLRLHARNTHYTVGTSSAAEWGWLNTPRSQHAVPAITGSRPPPPR